MQPSGAACAVQTGTRLSCSALLVPDARAVLKVRVKKEQSPVYAIIPMDWRLPTCMWTSPSWLPDFEASPWVIDLPQNNACNVTGPTRRLGAASSVQPVSVRRGKVLRERGSCAVSRKLKRGLRDSLAPERAAAVNSTRFCCALLSLLAVSTRSTPTRNNDTTANAF